MLDYAELADGKNASSKSTLCTCSAGATAATAVPSVLVITVESRQPALEVPRLGQLSLRFAAPMC